MIRLKTKAVNRSLWFLLLLLIIAPGGLQAQDNCSAASVINISSSGYGLGTFTSAQLNIGTASLQFGEVFHNVQVLSGNDKKTLWYTFTLPTARAVNLALKQPGTDIAEDGAGFTVYYNASCLPTLADIPPAKLTPLNKFGSSYNPCLLPGVYLVQVSAKTASIGDVFLELTLSDPGLLSTYDRLVNAQNMGTVSGGWYNYSYDVGCLTIESAAETCPTVPNSAEYTQSSWHVFKTDNFVDALRFEISEATASGNFVVGYNLYLGDARVTGLGSLSLIDGCRVLQSSGGWVGKSYLCELLPNTYYSIQLLYHKDYSNTVNYRIIESGSGITDSPDPSAMNASTQLGTLPASVGGTWTYGKDTLSCNAFIIDHACGTVNPASGIVNSNGTNYTLNTWYTFTLAQAANVRFYTSYGMGKRLFSGNVATNCNVTPMLEWSGDDYTYPCLPAGTYSVQLLGNFDTLYFGGHLSLPAPLSLQVTSVNIVNNFQLFGTGQYNQVNYISGIWEPLPDGVQIYSTSASYGCPNTVLPSGTNCYAQNKKAIFREVVIGDADGDGLDDSGILTVGGTNGWYLNYILFRGDANALATAQGADTYGETITGLNDISGCFNWETRFCVTPGIYTLVSFGDSTDVARSDQPWFRFDITETQFDVPASPEMMGDITVAVSAGTISSSIDYFSCNDNPLTIDGQTPCSGATKQIYREFYISSPLILNISQSGGYSFRLFSGRISSGVGTLSSIIPGYGDLGCRGSWGANVCMPLAAGWYTIVTYGGGGNFSGPTYSGGSIGQPTFISMSTSSSPLPPFYNRPHKAYDAGVTDWGPNAGSSTFPVNGRTYTFGTERLNCIDDLPFAAHPITECDASLNRVGYFVFTVTKESFISITGIPTGMQSRIYDLDVRTNDSLLMPTATPIQTCINRTDLNYERAWWTWIGKIEVCRLQPGTYTLAVFAGNSFIGTSYTPVLYVDETGYSRFDHAINAYDFGEIPGDSVNYLGKIGDVNPIDPARAASNDLFYCTTNAFQSDPGQSDASTYCWDGLFPDALNNQSVIQPVGNDQPHYSVTTNVPVRRNLWYTFVVDGPGRVFVSVYNRTSGKLTQMPFAIYQTDEDATVPFSTLVAGGDVDSTILQGLTFIRNSSYSDWWGCAGNSQTVSFDISPCETAMKRRYFIVVDQHAGLTPVDQIEVGVKFEDVPVLPTVYDHYSEANVINGLGQTAPPYINVALINGVYSGATGSFACATKDTPDQNSCGTRTLWYKFTSDISGKIRIHYSVNGGSALFDANNIMLFRELIPGDSTSLGLENIPLTSVNAGGEIWGESCLAKETYYLMLTGCSYTIETAEPEIWLISESGDLCSDPVEISLSGPGNGSGSVTVNCHTIGEAYGEDGSAMGCLFGPGGYKSSWFKVDLNFADKVDLTFQLTENTTALPSQIRYRVLYGVCAAMTAGPCNSDAGTEFTLNCMMSDSNSYYVQVVTPENATGTLTLNVEAALSPNQSCEPFDPLAPTANFTVNPGCVEEPICFTNQSSQGDSIIYHWDFGVAALSNDTSNLENPCYQFPLPVPANNVDVYNVTLIVYNIISNTSDTVVVPVAVYPSPSGFITHVPPGSNISAGIPIDFSSNTGNTIVVPPTSWSWDFGNGTGSTDENPTGITYGSGDLGQNVINLTITNGYCSITVSDTLMIGYEPIYNGGIFDGSAQVMIDGCPDEDIWNGGPYDGASFTMSDGCAEEDIWNGGLYDGAALFLIDGCPDEDIWDGGPYDGAASADANNLDYAAVLANDSVCQGQPLTWTINITTGAVDQVIFFEGNTQIGTIGIPVANGATFSYTPTSSGTFYADIYGTGSCDSIRETFNVIVVTAPIANAGPDISTCGQEIHTIGTTGISGFSYLWSPSASLNNASIAQPDASPSTTTTYTLSVSDASGVCPVATDQATITVVERPNPITAGDTLVCNVSPAIDLVASGSATSWAWFELDDFTYELAVTLTNSVASTLTNYQVRIELNTADLIANGKMRPDCGDLRVFASDHTTPLDFWIEDGTCDSAITVVWVEIPSLPNGNTDIYFHYGNLSLTSASNGFSVFEFFDDFNQAALHAQWTNTNGAIAPSLNNGKLMLNNANGNGVFASGYKIQENSIAESYASLSSTATYGSPLRFTLLGNAWVNDGSSNITDILWYGGSYYYEWHASEAYVSPMSIGYHRYRFDYRKNGTTSIDYFIDGASYSSRTESANTNNTLSPVIYSSASSSNAMADWIFVRKYASTEPTNVLGAEIPYDAISNTQNCIGCGDAFAQYLVYAANGNCFAMDTLTVVDANSSYPALAYRTIANGNWTNVNIWEVYDPVSLLWVPANTFGYCNPISYPTSDDSTILVRHDVVYDFTIPQGVDELTVATTGIVRIPAGITFNMVDVSSSLIAEDVMNYGRINIAGLFTVVGSALLSNDDNSTVAYINGNQTMWNGKYGKLEVDGGGIKTVSGTTTRANTDVLFINGHIQLNARNFRLGVAATTTGASYATGWFVTNGAGQLIKENMSNYIFELGPSVLAYNKASLVNSGVIDHIGVRVSPQFDFHPVFANDELADTSSVNRTWYLTEATAGGSNISIDLFWIATDENPDFNRNDCHYGDYNASTGWQIIGPNGIASGTGTLIDQYHYAYAGITDLRQYTIGSCAIGALKYRTIANGNWTDVSIWEVFDQISGNWIAAPLFSGYCGAVSYPTSASDSVWVRHNVTYDFTIPIGIDQTKIEAAAVLTVPSTIDLMVVDGLGNDLWNEGKIVVTGSMNVAAAANLNNRPLSIVHYNGGNQIVYNGTFASLWIDGNIANAGALKALSGSLTRVDEALRFINGKVVCGNENITLAAACAVSGAGQNTGYIVATGSGYCIWEFPFGSLVSRRFPVGGAYYSFADLVFNTITSAGTLMCRVTETAHPTDPSTIKRFWTITQGSIVFSGNYSATLNYNDVDLPSIPVSIADEMAMVEIGAVWSLGYPTSNHWYYSPSPITNVLDVSSNVGTITHSQFSDFTFRPNTSSLPVSLLMLAARWNGADAVIDWSTVSESNNQGFIVERSMDAIHFDSLGYVHGAGNSNELLHYQFTDFQLRDTGTAQVYFFRLRQLDFDGSESVSPIVSLQHIDDNPQQSIILAYLYPNPAATGENIFLGIIVDSDQMISLIIKNVNGQLLEHINFDAQTGMNHFIWRPRNISTGSYLIQIVGADFSLERKLIIISNYKY